jgi:cyclic-di-GMP-binding protein
VGAAENLLARIPDPQIPVTIAMADSFSFDIVSDVNLQEVDNAINQARKEIAQRYDFKGSKSSIDLNMKEKQITLHSEDDFKLKSVVDILQTKLIKRSVPVKALAYGAVEPAAGGTVRQIITLRVGIDKENAKRIVKMIKDTKMKVQAQIMDDQVRVSGKAKDDLQSVMKLVRDADLEFAVQFTNYR